MPFPPLKIPHAVDALEAHVEDLIFTGVLRPGALLPSERQLAVEVGVSRTTLRDGLSRLRAKGLLFREGGGHRISDAMDVILASSLDGLDQEALPALKALFARVADTVLELAQTKAVHHDETALSKAVAAAIEDVNASGTVAPAIFNELFMVLAEGAHNFFVLQVTHTFLRGFADYHADALWALAEMPDARARLISALEALRDSKTGAPSALLSQLHDGAKTVRLSASYVNAEPRFDEAENSAALRVEEHVLSGRFEADELLPPPHDIARELDLSDDAVKLALHRLAAHGVVEVEKLGRSRLVSQDARDPVDAFVAAVLRHPDAIRAMFEFRGALEEWSAELAAAHATADQKNELSGLLNAMAPLTDADPAAYSKLDIDLHRRLAELTGNRPLASLLSALWRAIQRVTAYWLVEHETFRGSNAIIHEQHVHLVEAVQRGDGPGAGAAMREHLGYVSTALGEIDRRKERRDVSERRRQLRAED